MHSLVLSDFDTNTKQGQQQMEKITHQKKQRMNKYTQMVHHRRFQFHWINKQHEYYENCPVIYVNNLKWSTKQCVFVCVCV